MTDERWKRAQIAEKKFWLSTKKSWSIQNPTQYWQGILDHGFNLDYDFFIGKSILEVGCGPVGIIFELDNAKSRIGLEPMDLDGLANNEKSSIVKKGIGEEIPFPDDSFDIVISFNALDHSINPAKVVQEIYRVLRKGGDFLLWIYVLRNHFQFLQSLMNWIDPPHPFHFTVDQLLIPIENSSFEIKYRKDDNGTGLPNNTVKKAIANHMMNTLWLWLKKRP
jgi:SAM-dependent methyltransferase